jgi:hypothetical protein
MRLFVAALIVTTILYYWNQSYNNGSLFDGLDSMRRSMTHAFFRLGLFCENLRSWGSR